MQPSQNLPNNDLVGASAIIETWGIYQCKFDRFVGKIIGFDLFGPCNLINIWRRGLILWAPANAPDERLPSTRMSFRPVIRWMKELFPAPVTPITATTT